MTYSLPKTLPLRALAVAVLALALALLGGAYLAQAAPKSPTGADIYVVDNLAKKPGASHVVDEVVYRFKNDTERFRVKKVPDVAEAIEALKKNPNIEYAEPNYIATISSVPNDTYYPLQWNMRDAKGGVYAESAWNVASGTGVTVAVIDTGVAYDAPDLAQTCFVSAGYDFTNLDNDPYDDNGHGTHVAGTIAQSTNNGVGVAGLAHGACIMPLKVLDAAGSGTYTAITDAIYYAANNGAQVISMSLGGPSDSVALKDAVAYAYGEGVTIVAAAGNDNNTNILYPAAYNDYVIAVGATRYDEKRAPYSNFGTALDIVAPGGDTSVDQNGDGYADGILQQTCSPCTKGSATFNYSFYQGTSMATPHVAAAAAMVIGKGDATLPVDVRAKLQNTAKDLGTAGRDTIYGFGLLNVAAALGLTIAPPPAIVMSVASIGYSLNRRDMLVTVTVKDENNALVSGASVGGTVRSGATTRTFAGTTSTSGQYRYTWKSAPSGTYATMITTLTKVGYLWNGVTPPNTGTK